MTSVEQLLQDTRLWRGKDRYNRGYNRDHSLENNSGNTPGKSHKNSISTGIATLDRQLHWRGWPLHCSSELLCQHWGIGELSLLAPVLKRVSKKNGKIAWINPPYVPYPPALTALGINPEQCLLLHSKPDDQWWTAEQTLSSSAFAVVLTWFTRQINSITPYRRLQAAAEKGQCLHFHFRPTTVRQHSSPARLRVYLQTCESQLSVEILKQPGGWAGQQLTISRPASLLFKQQSPQLWPAYQDPRSLRRPAIGKSTILADSFSINPLTGQQPEHLHPESSNRN